VPEVQPNPARWCWGDSPSLLRRVLAADGLLAIPSESSYGLAVDPFSAAAVAAIYRLKRRATHQPLLVVVADVGQLAALGIRIPRSVLDSLVALWPAALTAVLPLDQEVPASSPATRLAVRVPAHRRLRELLRELGPLTSTSANAAGQAPICRPAELERWLAREVTDRPTAIVDDGELPGGLPSTVVAWQPSGWRLLRRGAVELPAAWELSPTVAGPRK